MTNGSRPSSFTQGKESNYRSLCFPQTSGSYPVSQEVNLFPLQKHTVDPPSSLNLPLPTAEFPAPEPTLPTRWR
jgi:hypothetical protein